MHLGDRTDSINVTLVRFWTRHHLWVAFLSSLLVTAPGNNFSPHTQVSPQTKVQPLIKHSAGLDKALNAAGNKAFTPINVFNAIKKITHWSVRGREQLIKSVSLQFMLHLWTA